MLNSIFFVNQIFPIAYIPIFIFAFEQLSLCRCYQGMYKNRVKNDRIFFLKFPLFYLMNEEIQSRKIQNSIYILNFPAPFSAGFPCLQDKREWEFQKKILSFFILFLYIPCMNLIIKIVPLIYFRIWKFWGSFCRITA